jgi:GTP-binding protein
MMIIRSANFVISSVSISKLPESNLPEYAFIGRSNVGKSSLINMICNNNKLAKTSSTPGKTQTINHFIINENWYLVDLPGYGYAKVSKKQRKLWESFSEKYLLKRENLMNLFVLIDSRLDPQKVDIEFMNWLGKKAIPFSIILTKIDKISKNEVVSNLEKLKKTLLETWEELPQIILSSAKKKTGKDEILDYIEFYNKL